MGRKVRSFTTAQRTALRVRHRTCSVEGCTIPAAFCHAHHKNPWSRGGKTDLKDATLLCPSHHRAVHLPGHTATYDGAVTRITKTVKRRKANTPMGVGPRGLRKVVADCWTDRLTDGHARRSDRCSRRVTRLAHGGVQPSGCRGSRRLS